MTKKEAEERYPKYTYRNKHGMKVDVDQKTALLYGEKMTPLNDRAKNLQAPEKNSRGEQINKEIMQ